MVPLALGTQTTGSTIKPGFVLRRVRVSADVRRHALRGASWNHPASLDTVTVYARTVEDIALYRDVLIGVVPGAAARRCARAAHRIRPSTAMAASSNRYTQRLLEDAARRCRAPARKSSDATMPPEFERLPKKSTASSRAANSPSISRVRSSSHWDELSEDLRNGKIKTGMELQLRALSCGAGHSPHAAGATLQPSSPIYDVLLAPSAVGEAPIGWNTGDSTLASPWSLMHTPTHERAGVQRPERPAGRCAGDRRERRRPQAASRPAAGSIAR